MKTIVTLLCLTLTTTLAAAANTPKEVKLDLPSVPTVEIVVAPVDQLRQQPVEAAAKPAPPAPEAAALANMKEQLAAYGKEIVALKAEIASYGTTIKILNDKLAQLENAKQKTPGEQEQDYESVLTRNGEDIFLVGVGKARMAKMENGQVAFRVPRDAAAKATGLLGKGIIAFYSTDDAAYFITSGASVRRN